MDCTLGGSKITRWNPLTGEQILSIPIPALYVTSCTFGGPNLTDLYITTARTRMTDAELKQYPHAGGIFRIQTNVKGCPTYSFRHETIGAETHEQNRLHKTRREKSITIFAMNNINYSKRDLGFINLLKQLWTC